MFIVYNLTAHKVVFHKQGLKNKTYYKFLFSTLIISVIMVLLNSNFHANLLNVFNTSHALIQQNTVTNSVEVSITEQFNTKQNLNNGVNVTDNGQEKLNIDTVFHYQLDRPSLSFSGETIVLLHGSGADETQLLSFARGVWPNANLLAVRGRVDQNGERRWYSKITPTEFNQQEAADEAEAFAQFIISSSQDLKIDLSKTIFVGYSNGANLLAILTMKHPDIVNHAVLLRTMPVLDVMPNNNLKQTHVLVLAGVNDATYAPYAPKLVTLLKENYALVDSQLVDSDHMIVDHDGNSIRRWLENEKKQNVSMNINAFKK